MLLVEDVTEFSHETVVVGAHLVIILILDTTLGKDRYWDCRLIIRVGI